MRYSIEPRGRISVKSYRILSFAKTILKNMIKSLGKNLSSKCEQKPLDRKILETNFKEGDPSNR